MLNWNCKERAGASQCHGHCHLLLAEKFHYGKWEYLHHCAERYMKEYPGQNYFLDLLKVSKSLGLVKSIGTSHIVINLTPSFGYDLLVISWNFDRDFIDAMDSAIKTLTQRFKSLTFNIGILFPPLEDGKIRKRLELSTVESVLTEDGAPKPFIGFLVDRGDPSYGRSTSDICGMELFASSVVSTDPFELRKMLKISDRLWS